MLIVAGKISASAINFLTENSATIEMFGSLYMISLSANAHAESLGTGDYTVVFTDDSEYDGPYLLVEHELNASDTRIVYRKPRIG